jgi:hypothetical protein
MRSIAEAAGRNLPRCFLLKTLVLDRRGPFNRHYLAIFAVYPSSDKKNLYRMLAKQPLFNPADQGAEHIRRVVEDPPQKTVPHSRDL